MLVGTLGASLLGNLLTGRGIVRAGSGKQWEFLIPPHPFTNLKYKSIIKINQDLMLLSKNNLPKKIKDGAYVINFDEYADVGTHWIALFCNRNEIVYFNSFGVEHVPEEI